MLNTSKSESVHLSKQNKFFSHKGVRLILYYTNRYVNKTILNRFTLRGIQHNTELPSSNFCGSIHVGSPLVILVGGTSNIIPFRRPFFFTKNFRRVVVLLANGTFKCSNLLNHKWPKV
jgi:hypothetical protein